MKTRVERETAATTRHAAAREAAHESPMVRHVLALQQAAGNAATTSALRRTGLLTRSAGAFGRSPSILLQRDLMAFAERRAQPTATGTRFHSADAPGIRAALAPLVQAGKVMVSTYGAEHVFSNHGATTAELASALANAGFDRARDMADAIAEPHNVSVYTGEEVRKTKFTRTKRQSQIERQTKRRLTAAEAGAAKRVFGSALKLDSIVISEGGLMTVGDYARTIPDRIYFPAGAFSHGNFPHWLIHELTHVWQYQRGAELPGMIFEALVGNYDYGGEAGLRKAWDDGKAFDEFTTEQQGDILADYYVRLIGGMDVSAYQGFVDQVQTGREKEHRYKAIKPLEAGRLDVYKLNNEARLKREQEIIRLLKLRVSASDTKAIDARAKKILALCAQSGSYWSGDYRDRFAQPRSDDELVTLVRRRLSSRMQRKVIEALTLTGSRAPRSRH